jgi:hypothetical protein
MGVSNGLMEKRKPHYALNQIKAAFADAASLNRSFVSKQGADELDMDDNAVVAVIHGLSPRDFDKSMNSVADHRVCRTFTSRAWAGGRST